jgi:hypothetical protein
MTNVRVRVTFAKNIYNETRCRKMTKAMKSFVLNLDFDKKENYFDGAYLIAGSNTHITVLVDLMCSCII